MRPIDKFILHVVHNWDNGLKEAYSAKIVSDLLTKFKDEADDLNIQITDAQLKAYIERFDAIRSTSKVTEKDIPSIRSSFETYTMIVTNQIEQDIVWTTSSDLGILNNGSVSELYLEATSVRNISYIIRAGSLPPNLTLLENGQITGRVPYQPTGALLAQGDSTTYTFTVQAYNPQFPVVQATREFTLTVYQKFTNPTDNIYLKAEIENGTLFIEGKRTYKLNGEEKTKSISKQFKIGD